MSLLTVRDLSVRYGALTVVDHVSVSLEEGQWLMLVGPNGAGKSTILNAVAQCVPYDGRVEVCGDDARLLKPAALAKRLGVLMQNHAVSYAFTVEEIVTLGRYAHRDGTFSSGATDVEAVARALARTGMEACRTQSVLTLSGGELQRTFLAQLIAQDPQILLLDEPTNHLDLAYQQQMFALVQDWIQQPGRAAVSVVHDLSLARAFGTHALLLHRGKTVAQGAIGDVLTRERLSNVYDIDVYGWMRRMLEQWTEA